MEIAKLYETAAENLEKAIEVCGKSKINLTTLTVIASVSGNIYSGINWKTLNDSYEEEPTTSEEEAISKMLIAGETAIESIVKLDADKKLPVDPEQKYLELIIRLNHENVKANVLQGKNSKVILTSVNSEIAKFAEQFAVPAPAEEANNAQNDNAKPQGAPELGPNEPEGSAAHAGIDASGLQMIFDDWESSADKAAETESKPFNGNTLSSDKAEVINQVQNMAGNGYQQQQSGMYGGQPMQGQQSQGGMYGGPMQGQGMYGQPMGQGMYGAQGSMYGGPMGQGMYGGQGGMYQQQSVNMYGGQPMGQQGQGGMYQQPMGQGMYGGGQPMGQQGMYGAQGGMYGGPMQGQGMYGQQQTAGRQSLYLNPANGQQANYNMPGAATSAFRSKLQAPVRTSVVNTQSVSVYGTNIGEGDNNAIFKDRLNDILNSTGPASSAKADENDKLDVMMSAKEKKNAAKKDAKNH